VNGHAKRGAIGDADGAQELSVATGRKDLLGEESETTPDAAVKVLGQAEDIVRPYLPLPQLNDPGHEPEGWKCVTVPPRRHDPIPVTGDEEEVFPLGSVGALCCPAAIAVELAQTVHIGRCRKAKSDLPHAVSGRFIGKLRAQNDIVKRTVDVAMDDGADSSHKTAAAEVAPPIPKKTYPAYPVPFDRSQFHHPARRAPAAA
jgi:hypothetical protein